MEDELLQVALPFLGYVVGGALQIGGEFIDHASDHVANGVAGVMDAFEVPGSDFVRDHGAVPISVIGSLISRGGEALQNLSEHTH